MNPQNPNQSMYSRAGQYVPPASRPSIVPPTTPADIPQFKNDGPGKTIAIIILTLTTVAFVGLFIWTFINWTDASTNLQGQIDNAVAIAINDREAELELEFAEREKTPYTTFSGPEDYGNLSFPYPKTWSLYVENDAGTGRDYTAYLNPGGVQPLSKTTVCALRVTIRNSSSDSVIAEWQRYVEKGSMTVSVIKVNNGESTANVYTGTLPSGLPGSAAIMKIRDKTAIIQTDSTEVFNSDFTNILSSLTFNS